MFPLPVMRSAKKFKLAYYLHEQKLSQTLRFVIFMNVYYLGYANWLIHVSFFLQNCNEAVFCEILYCSFQSIFVKLRSFIHWKVGLICRSLSDILLLILLTYTTHFFFFFFFFCCWNNN